MDIYVFTDAPSAIESSRFKITYFEIEHLPFPYPTLYRYKYFNKYAHHLNAENLYYLDVDMVLVGDVGEEILTVWKH